MSFLDFSSHQSLDDHGQELHESNFLPFQRPFIGDETHIFGKLTLFWRSDVFTYVAHWRSDAILLNGRVKVTLVWRRDVYPESA